MADQQNLVLEHLRHIRAENADIKAQVNRVHLRLSSIENQLISLRHDMIRYEGAHAEANNYMETMFSRIERIERRLDIADEA